MFFGGRIRAGITGFCGQVGLEGGGILLGERSLSWDGQSAQPGLPSQKVKTESSSQLWGAETNLVGNLLNRPNLGIDLLTGFRFVNLGEDWNMTLASTALPGQNPALGGFPLPAPANLSLSDSIRARNQFYGGQLGSHVELRLGKFYTHLIGKAALGAVHEVIDTRSETIIQGPAGNTTFTGGLPVPVVGVGRQTRGELAVVPEVNLNVGYQLRPGLRLYAGYNFLYLGDVVRPGDLSNNTVNLVPIPSNTLLGASNPTGSSPVLNHSDFWAQGINFGLAVRY
jgi:hypothetical protein